MIAEASRQSLGIFGEIAEHNGVNIWLRTAAAVTQLRGNVPEMCR